MHSPYKQKSTSIHGPCSEVNEFEIKFVFSTFVPANATPRLNELTEERAEDV